MYKIHQCLQDRLMSYWKDPRELISFIGPTQVSDRAWPHRHFQPVVFGCTICRIRLRTEYHCLHVQNQLWHVCMYYWVPIFL